MHTPATYFLTEYTASGYTKVLYKWKLKCRIEPNQNQQGVRCAAHQIQLGPCFQTCHKRCNFPVTSQSQPTLSANILPHTLLISYQSITIFINCLSLQYVNLVHTNNYIPDGSHLVPHLLAHVQVYYIAAFQQPPNHSHLRELNRQRSAHNPIAPYEV